MLHSNARCRLNTTIYTTLIFHDFVCPCGYVISSFNILNLITLIGLPIVKFLCGQEVTVKPMRWTFKLAGGVFFTRKQVPLKLAWAISIHKSQVITSLSLVYKIDFFIKCTLRLIKKLIIFLMHLFTKDLKVILSELLNLFCSQSSDIA
jgi:hypothetical protein